MHPSAKHLVVGSILVGAVFIAGCASPPGAMSEQRLAGVREAAGEVRPGLTRDEVLRELKPAHAVSLGASTVDGVAVEEWKIEAFHDSGKGRDLFVRFYYFIDGTLVDASDRRIDFRENRELVRSWAGETARK